MTPTDKALNELADRVERATGPDRELDADICELIDLPLCVPPDCSPEVFRTIIERTRAGGAWDQDPECPFYTASLDAAMTLVPEGATTGIFANFGDGGCKAFVGIMVAKASTPALALTTAALRALAATEGSER